METVGKWERKLTSRMVPQWFSVEVFGARLHKTDVWCVIVRRRPEMMHRERIREAMLCNIRGDEHYRN